MPPFEFNMAFYTSTQMKTLTGMTTEDIKLVLTHRLVRLHAYILTLHLVTKYFIGVYAQVCPCTNTRLSTISSKRIRFGMLFTQSTGHPNSTVIHHTYTHRLEQRLTHAYRTSSTRGQQTTQLFKFYGS
jgi:hypothetical protein